MRSTRLDAIVATLIIVIALAVVWGLIACSPVGQDGDAASPPPPASAPELYRDRAGDYVTTWSDPVTGCQYLVFHEGLHNALSVVPRVDPTSHAPKCG